MEGDTPTSAKNIELDQVEQQNSEVVLMEQKNDESVPVAQQNNDLALGEEKSNEPPPVLQQRHEVVPVEQQDNEVVAMEQQSDELVPTSQQNNELAPVEEKNNELTPVPQQKNDELVPVAQQNNEGVLVEEKNNELTPVPHQNSEPVSCEQQGDDVVSIEQQYDELVAEVQHNNEVVPVEEKNNELTPVPHQNNEPVSVEQQGDDVVSMEQQYDELAAAVQHNNEVVSVEEKNNELSSVPQQNSELVPVEQQDHGVPMEQQNDELYVVVQPNNEVEQQDDVVPMEQQNDELVVVQPNNEVEQQDDVIIVEQQNDELVIVVQPSNEVDQQDDVVIMEQQNDELVVVVQPNNEVEQQDDVVPMEQQNDELVVVVQPNNEVVRVEEKNNDLSPVLQQNSELLSVEQQDDVVPLEQQNDELVVVVQPNNEVVRVEEKNNELSPVPQQNSELVSVEHQDDVVPMEQQNDELVVVLQQNNEVVQKEEKNNELTALPQQNNELVQVEHQNNEVVPMEQQSDEIVAVVQQNDEVIPVEEKNIELATEPQQNSEVVQVEHQHNEVVPMKHQNDVLVAVVQQNNELVQAEQQNNEIAPTEQQNNELSPALAQQKTELVAEEQQKNELLRVAYQKCELQPVVQQNNKRPLVEQSQSDYEAQPSRRRKKSSIVWEHFTIEYVGAGIRRAYCKQCKQSFAYSTGSKVAGTSHLKRHIAKGACPLVLRNQQNGPSTPLSAPSKMGAYDDTPKRRFRTPQSQYFSFDPDHSRHEIARMILMHDYPLHMVEHSGFVSFARSLQPRFDMVSFNTVQEDCVSTYLKEKQTLQKMIETMPGHISLALDMWSSSRTVGYVVLTGHFIDSDWKLQSKILSVIMEPYPESDTAFSHAVAACLCDWNLEGKVFSITINQPLSDASIDNLRALVSVKNPLVLSGQLLIGNCLARTLSNIAQDAFTSISLTIKKIRDSVKYVKTSESQEDKFLQLKQQLQIPSSKVLALDDRTRWNTTYEMLLAAAELKEVFSCLDTSDPDYKDVPSMEDWKQVESLCAYLNPLFDTANILASASFPTTNTFFHEAWKIQLELARAAANEDSFISNLTKPMQEKFDKYWKSCCFILAFAVVMDPRFKMKLVEFSFQKIYGDEKAPEYVKVVDEGIHELFLEYASLPSDLMEIDGVNTGAVKPDDRQGGDTEVANVLGLIDFDMYIKQTNSQDPKSELDQYLEESLLPRVHEFDVVGWWRLNKEKYPILSRMARDVLYVPVCSVAQESVFDTVKKEMDPYRCSLRPETIEALICAKDWIQSPAENDSSTIVKLEVPI